jgi:hypothetical protein
MAKTPRRPSSAPSRRRQPPREPWATRSSLAPTFTPHSLDAQRYALFRSGLSAAEIAARENVKLATVEKSIEKMRAQSEIFSKEAMGVETRRAIMSALPTGTSSLIEALTATKDKIIAGEEGETSVIQEADHHLRLKAIAGLTALINSMKESAPLVSVSQQNLQQNATNTNIAGGLSAESIIRQIREKRGMTHLDPVSVDVDDTPLPDTIDFEESGKPDEEDPLLQLSLPSSTT